MLNYNDFCLMRLITQELNVFFSSRAFVISDSSKFMGIVEAKQINH